MAWQAPRFLGFLFATAFGGKMTELMYPRLACTLACAIAAVISQIGDLAASAIKRNHNIKGLRQPDPGTRRHSGPVPTACCLRLRQSSLPCCFCRSINTGRSVLSAGINLHAISWKSGLAKRRVQMKRIAILGSTGSIGTQTLEVVENNQGYSGNCSGGRKQHQAAGGADPQIPSDLSMCLG